MFPKVSIVIPVYNGANYMREAIDSALNQSYKNCEVLVVNDGSTDETEEIALSYGDKIRYFKKENGGVSTALNVGIQNMEGEYFCFLPHDDIFLPDKIELQIEAAQKSGFMAPIVWSKSNWLINEKKMCIEEDTNYYYNDSEYLMNGNFPVYLGLVRTISVMVHRSYFEKYGLFDDNLYTSQDYDMWYRIFQNQRTVYIDKPLVTYRIHEEQGTNTDDTFYFNCVELALKKFHEISEEEIAKLFGNRYRFVYYMMVYYKEEALWKECWELAFKLFCAMDEPCEVEEECRALNNYLQGSECIHENRIVIWCAGKNAIRLLREFRERKVPVYALCDRDEKKQGTIIQGYRCLAPDEVDKESSRIIVSMDDPDALGDELLARGYKHVTSYKEIGSRVHHTLPYKQEVISEMQSSEN